MTAQAGVKFWDKFHSFVAMTAKLPFSLQLVKFIPDFTPVKVVAIVMLNVVDTDLVKVGVS